MAYTRQQFVNDLGHTRRGGKLVYHVGLLMRDRQMDKDVNNVAWAAWNAYVEGRCTLVQRRLRDAIPSACEYIAVRV